jgi:DNA-directed RNA polymerase specialized sigma24 family protein
MTEDAIRVVMFIALLVSRLIREAIEGNEEALRVLAELPWTLDLIKKVSTSVAARFHEDRDEIASELWLVLRTKISSLERPQRIGSFLYAAGKNQCSNRKRHLRVERVHRGGIALFNPQKDDCLQDGAEAPTDSEIVEETEGRPLVIFAQEMRRSNRSQDPEQKLLERGLEDETALVNTERVEKLSGVISRSSQSSEKIIHLWSLWKSPDEISKELGVSVQTVYRVLKKFERAACAEFGVDPDNPACRLSLKRALYHRPKASEPGDPLTQKPLIELDRP